jgi:hypothetical protein
LVGVASVNSSLPGINGLFGCLAKLPKPNVSLLPQLWHG